jgi:hypothetical protein
MRPATTTGRYWYFLVLGPIPGAIGAGLLYTVSPTTANAKTGNDDGDDHRQHEGEDWKDDNASQPLHYFSMRLARARSDSWSHRCRPALHRQPHNGERQDYRLSE